MLIWQSSQTRQLTHRYTLTLLFRLNLDLVKQIESLLETFPLNLCVFTWFSQAEEEEEEEEAEPRVNGAVKTEASELDLWVKKKRSFLCLDEHQHDPLSVRCEVTGL